MAAIRHDSFDLAEETLTKQVAREQGIETLYYEQILMPLLKEQRAAMQAVFRRMDLPSRRLAALQIYLKQEGFYLFPGFHLPQDLEKQIRKLLHA